MRTQRNVSVWKTYAFVENAIRDQTAIETTGKENSEQIWIRGPKHINQYFHQLWNITMKQFIALMWRCMACFFFFLISISGKICLSQTLHVLTLLKLTSRKEVIKWELVYPRDHLDNKCSIRTHQLYLHCCALSRSGCACFNLWLLFRAGNWTILESKTERIFIYIQVIWLWTGDRSYAWAEHTLSVNMQMEFIESNGEKRGLSTINTFAVD